MIEKPHALYYLDLGNKGGLYEVEGKDFDVRSYSRMKYGVLTEIEGFARQLVSFLKANRPQVFTGNEPPALMVAYDTVPPPVVVLVRHCLDEINYTRLLNGLAPGEIIQIHRLHDFVDDYAHLSKDDRKNALSIQKGGGLQGRSLDGYQAVLIDDIFVTGSHTDMVRSIVGVTRDIYAVYIAACIGKARHTPCVEGMLNNVEIQCATDLLTFIYSDDFIFTRRFLKLLLHMEVAELAVLMEKLPAPLLKQVIRGVVDTGAEIRDIFPDTCAIILRNVTD